MQPMQVANQVQRRVTVLVQRKAIKATVGSQIKRCKAYHGMNVWKFKFPSKILQFLRLFGKVIAIPK